MCYWLVDDLDPNTGHCLFRPIQGDLMRVIIVALISALVSAPLSLSVQYIINDILSKETLLDEANVVAHHGGVPDHRQVISPAAAMTKEKILHNAICEGKGLKERCGESAIEDMQNLIRDILAYRKGINTKEQDTFDGKTTSLFIL